MTYRYEEVGEGEGDNAQRAPHKEHLSTQVGVTFIRTDEVWSDDTNDLLNYQQGSRQIRILDVRSSRTNWMMLINPHRGHGWEEERSLQ